MGHLVKPAGKSSKMWNENRLVMGATQKSLVTWGGGVWLECGEDKICY